ncbi:MAG TPA: ABC transporter substrate binding protein [Geomonas sp.]|nr:ABC transporter substrate binding protein [Geomonas sp.]
MTVARRVVFLTTVLVYFFACLGYAADVLIVGDTNLKPVMETISGIEKTLRTPVKIISPLRVRNNLNAVVAEEEARVVVALGKEAVAESLRLPSSVLVIYDLVLVPPSTSRPNTTGLCMATPASDYLSLLANHLHDIGPLSVVGSRELIGVLAGSDSPRLSTHSVRDPFEMVSTIKQLNGAGAVLLLPDVHLLTSAALEQIFLFSFRRRIPILGFSEKSVKDGALLALVVDTFQDGRLIGEWARRSLSGGDSGKFLAATSRKLDLFLNLDTARRMGIRIPDELLRRAKRCYP